MSVITRIVLVRHTQTVGNVEKRLTGREDYPLTPDGEKYVDKLTNRLKGIKFDKAYASTSGRTVKTIQKIADLNNIKIEQDENLCEMYFGIYDGWKWEDVNKVNPKIKQNQIETNEIMEIPEQESTKQVETRMTNAITKIAKENIGKTILICSHGVAIEAFIRGITKKPFSVNIKENSQKNTSVNIISYDSEKNKFNVELLNDISHLQLDKYYICTGSER